MFEIQPFLRVSPSLGVKSDHPIGSVDALVRIRQSALKKSLEELRKQVSEEQDIRDTFWVKRSFPVLSILSPAMTSHEGKVEYPGDPICLYFGISKMISGVQASLHDPFSDQDEYLTHCPQLGRLPSLDYRNQQGNTTKRTLEEDWSRLNTDQTVFDPRVWNAETRKELHQWLDKFRPVIVLVSSVSCAHRYALAITHEIKTILPDTVVVLGGRHADETVTYHEAHKLVSYSHSSTVRAAYDGRTTRDIDFVISRDGAFGLDFLMKALSLIYDPLKGKIEQSLILEALQYMAGLYQSPRGRSIITWLSPHGPQAVLFSGPRYSLSDLPHSYYAFAIRAHFPIFTDELNLPVRTAHMLTTDACPYQCSFCSEGIGVVGRMNKLSRAPAEVAISRMEELADYGAQAVFFDDSVMFGGNMAAIRDFSLQLATTKKNLKEANYILKTSSSRDLSRRGTDNLLNMQWGAQLTGEFLSTFQSEEQAREMLSAMAESGCTYVYFGIESLAEGIISKIHKHQRAHSDLKWIDKIRTSLRLVKSAGIRVGSSVLFGLDGENRNTIDETIDGIAKLIEEGLLDLASPNIMTYHPGTEITRLHQMENSLDYHSLAHDVHPPYSYFEQAFPGVVSKHLSESDIWYIHGRANSLWGNVRNSNEAMKY